MFHIFILAIRFCLILSFCTQFYFFFSFAKSYKGAVKCAHSALSKNSIVSLQHCQKSDFAFAVSWHNRSTYWVEWILAKPWRGAPGVCISLSSAGTACTKASLPPSPSVSPFLLAPNQELGINRPFPCPGPVPSKIHLFWSFKYHL